MLVQAPQLTSQCPPLIGPLGMGVILINVMNSEAVGVHVVFYPPSLSLSVCLSLSLSLSLGLSQYSYMADCVCMLHALCWAGHLYSPEWQPQIGFAWSSCPCCCLRNTAVAILYSGQWQLTQELNQKRPGWTWQNAIGDHILAGSQYSSSHCRESVAVSMFVTACKEPTTSILLSYLFYIIQEYCQWHWGAYNITVVVGSLVEEPTTLQLL